MVLLSIQNIAMFHLNPNMKLFFMRCAKNTCVYLFLQIHGCMKLLSVAYFCKILRLKQNLMITSCIMLIAQLLH